MLRKEVVVFIIYACYDANFVNKLLQACSRSDEYSETSTIEKQCLISLHNSKPVMLDWTLTLPIDHGTILLSFLAFLVTIAGTSAWGFLASLLHSMLARRHAGVDVIGLQHQVIFRNSAGALGTVLDLVKVQFAWTKVMARGSWGKTMLLAIVSLITWGLGFLCRWINPYCESGE
ncbi:hypothetical protein AB5N19_02508 [Seiridium cardinale]